MDIIKSLLKIAKEKKLDILALFLATGFIVFTNQYKIKPFGDILFIDKIPDGVIWIFSTVHIFSGIFLLLCFFETLFKCVFDLKNLYVPHHGARILKFFSNSDHNFIPGYEIAKKLGMTTHKFDYYSKKLIMSGYLETDGDYLDYNGPKYWLTQKGRGFLAKRFLL